MNPIPIAPISVGIIWGGLTNAQQTAVLNSVAKQGAKRLTIYRDTLRKSVGFRKGPPEQRLTMFRNRPPEVWDAIRTKFPKTYKEQMDDWRNLEEGDENAASSAEGQGVGVPGFAGSDAVPGAVPSPYGQLSNSQPG